MRILAWLLRAILFMLLVVLALNNSHEAVVRLYFGAEWRAPTMVVLLVVFAAGAACGVLALLPTLLALRRGQWQERRVSDEAASASPSSGSVADTAIAVATPGRPVAR